MNGLQIPTPQQCSGVLLQSLIVICVSSIVVPLWKKYYRKWLILLHAISFSSSYYHWTGDFSGFVMLLISLAVCVVGSYHLHSYLATIALMTLFGTTFRASLDFLCMFLIRGLFDVFIDNLEPLLVREHSEKDVVTNFKHLLIYFVSTCFVMKNRPERNGREDLLLIAILAAQAYALFQDFVTEDIVIITGLFSFAWAKVKSMHVQDIRSRRMRPAFENWLRAALPVNPGFNGRLSMIRNILGI